MDPTIISQVKNLISDKDQPIAIVTHTNPDGDALGSSLGLYGFFKLSGYKQVVVISPDRYPSFLEWMPWESEILIADQVPDQAERTILDSDLIFCLDFNGLSRLNHLEDILRKSKGKKILIDHHPQPQDDFDIIFSDTGSSSTAEMIFDFILALGGESLIDRRVAECLYAGIVTDTGSFSYGCNDPKTYIITARLIALGVDGEHLHRLIYNTYSADRMRLLGFCLSERLKVLPEEETAHISLSSADLKRFNYQEGDTEGVVNFAMSIKNIHLAALFIEKEDHVKISFRSSGVVDVNMLARKYFNGGGHRNAAGGKSYLSLEETILRFEETLRKDQE